MKIVYALFITIFVSFKLSAAPQATDSSKIVVHAIQYDSSYFNKPLFHNDSLRLVEPLKTHTYTFTEAGPSSYSVRLSSFNALPDSLKFPSSKDLFALSNAFDNLTPPDSVKNLLVLNHADSLRIIATLKQRDSLKLVEAVKVDSLKIRIKTMSLDSLKIQLRANQYQTLKAPLYSEISSRYLDYDTLSNKRQRAYYQNQALAFTMLALHQYSMYNDTIGLRNSFDNLAKVYFAQQKYSQAKWFILQSNSLSRIKRDVPHIISSLITLSEIKSEIGDYNLAMRDLNEALQLSIANHYPKIESNVLRNYGLLYSRLKNYDKEELVLKKRDSLEESMRKEEDAKLLASLNTQNLVQKKKIDSLQKKKVYISNIHKPYKNNSAKKLVSL